MKELEITLDRIEELAIQRNKIAHNPVMFWLDSSGEHADIVNAIFDGKLGIETNLDMDAIESFTANCDEA